MENNKFPQTKLKLVAEQSTANLIGEKIAAIFYGLILCGLFIFVPILAAVILLLYVFYYLPKIFGKGKTKQYSTKCPNCDNEIFITKIDDEPLEQCTCIFCKCQTTIDYQRQTNTFYGTKQ